MWWSKVTSAVFGGKSLKRLNLNSGLNGKEQVIQRAGEDVFYSGRIISTKALK